MLRSAVRNEFLSINRIVHEMLYSYSVCVWRGSGGVWEVKAIKDLTEFSVLSNGFSFFSCFFVFFFYFIFWMCVLHCKWLLLYIFLSYSFVFSIFISLFLRFFLFFVFVCFVALFRLLYGILVNIVREKSGKKHHS